MSKLLSVIKKHKRDYSPFLYHFTKGRKTYKDDPEDEFNRILVSETSAFENLKKIISDQDLKASFSYMTHKCVCLTESPITEITRLMSLEEWDSSRYEPYGLALRKECIFKYGGRPVIYQQKEQQSDLGDSHKFLHSTFDSGSVDFSWEREWRCKGNLSFNREDVIFIVKTSAEAFNLMNDYSGKISVTSLDLLLS